MSQVRDLLARHRFLLGVAAAYLLLRLFSGLVLYMASRAQDPSYLLGDGDPYFRITSTWDGMWYRRIAEEGYPETLPRWIATDEVRQNPWAFYPMFPYLTRGLMGLFGTGFEVTATTLSLVLGLAAALVMARLMDVQVGRVGAWATVVLFAAFPASPVLQMAYTESLAMLLLCLFLLSVLRERWLVAAGLALVTGLSRPIALPLGLVALVALVVRWRRRGEEPLHAEEWVRGIVALVACGVSGLLWPAIAWWGTGERNAYALTMSSWRGGKEIVPFENWHTNAVYLVGDVAAPILLVAIVISLLALVLGPWAAGLGPVLRTWCLGYALYLGAVLDPWTSTFRYLLMLFPLAAVLAGAAWPRVRRVARDAGTRGREVALAASTHPDWVVAARTGFILLWFLVGQVVWVWELVLFIPPADDPP